MTIWPDNNQSTNKTHSRPETSTHPHLRIHKFWSSFRIFASENADNKKNSQIPNLALFPCEISPVSEAVVILLRESRYGQIRPNLYLTSFMVLKSGHITSKRQQINALHWVVSPSRSETLAESSSLVTSPPPSLPSPPLQFRHCVHRDRDRCRVTW